MQQFEIAMMVVRQGDKFHLQLRNGATQIGALNLIGCFGGKLEPGEEAVDAACRELSEESTFGTTPEQVRRLGEVTVDSERRGQPIRAHAEVFEAVMRDDETITALEGELVTMTAEEVRANLHNLTPATRATFIELIKE